MEPHEWAGSVHPGMNGKIVTEWVFVRHCESESNKQLMGGGGVIERDVALTPLGLRQAEAVQAAIKPMLGPDTAVYVSPLRRARQTLGDDIECSMLYPLREFCRDGTGVKVEETRPELRTRVIVTIERLSGSAKRIIVVGHSLWIADCLGYMMGLADQQVMFHLGNGSISIVHDTTWGVEVQMVGGIQHLPPEIRTGHHTKLHVSGAQTAMLSSGDATTVDRVPKGAAVYGIVAPDGDWITPAVRFVFHVRYHELPMWGGRFAHLTYKDPANLPVAQDGTLILGILDSLERVKHAYAAMFVSCDGHGWTKSLAPSKEWAFSALPALTLEEFSEVKKLNPHVKDYFIRLRTHDHDIAPRICGHRVYGWDAVPIEMRNILWPEGIPVRFKLA